MKFFQKLATLVATVAITVPAWAQFTSQKPENQVAKGDTALKIENVAGKPGTAVLVTSGLIMVTLSDEAQPAGMKVDAAKPDTSDPSKTANLASFKANPAMAASNKLCWRGAGSQGWYQMSCAKVNADGTAKHQLVMTAKGETFALTPELQNAKGEHVAWVSHPGEVRRQLHCGNESKQASVFRVDDKGIIKAATPEEADDYDKNVFAKICKAAA